MIKLVKKLVETVGYEALGFKKRYRNEHNTHCPKCHCNKKVEDEGVTSRGPIETYRCLHCGANFERTTLHLDWVKEVW